MALLNYEDVAEYFVVSLNYRDIDISNLKLQKIMYYAQSWYLAVTHNRLFNADFEAWKHGAVIRPLYYKYSIFGYNNINIFCDNEQYLRNVKAKFGDYVCDFLDKIIKEYAYYTAEELRDINHKELPWRKARVNVDCEGRSSEVIRSEWMEKYYGNYAVEKGWKEVKDNVFKFSLKELKAADERIEKKKVFTPDETNIKRFHEFIIDSYESTKETLWRALDGSKL
ncbi:MAG: Panacea domain-containing protein [Caulobacteraceae bacterium]